MDTASERVMARLVASYIDHPAIWLITDGSQGSTKLLEDKFDLIFLTTPAKAARSITAAAAKHLTPTTLELDGQCPAIIIKSTITELVAKRVAAMKFLNARQICLSVNHVFDDPSVHEEFLVTIEYYTRRFANIANMCHIINHQNYGHLKVMVDKSDGNVIRCRTGPKRRKRYGSRHRSQDAFEAQSRALSCLDLSAQSFKA